MAVFSSGLSNASNIAPASKISVPKGAGFPPGAPLRASVTEQYAADMPKTEEMAERVYGGNIDGLATVVAERMSLAETPLYQNDPVAQMRMLLGAGMAIADYLNAIYKDVGDNPSPQLQGVIKRLLMMKTRVLQRLAALMGVKQEAQPSKTKDASQVSNSKASNQPMSGNVFATIS